MFSFNSDVRAWVGMEEHKMLDHNTLKALHCGGLYMFEMFLNVFLQFRCPCLVWKGFIIMASLMVPFESDAWSEL